MAKRVTTLSLSDEARQALEEKAKAVGKSMSGFIEWVALGENTVNDIFTDKENRDYFFKMRKEFGAQYLNRLVAKDRELNEGVREAVEKGRKESSDEPAEVVELSEEPTEPVTEESPEKPVAEQEPIEEPSDEPVKAPSGKKNKKPLSIM